MAKDSRTSQAVRRVMNGERARDVANELKLSESAVYAAVKREREKRVCPCCRSVVNESQIDQSALREGLLPWVPDGKD